MVKFPSATLATTLARGTPAVALAMLALAPHAALAHHPTGGMMPTSARHGFLSGLGHPVIGFDHLAYLVGLTMLAAGFGRPLTIPAGFVAALIGGVLLHVAGVALPHVESLVTLSVVFVGMMLALALRRLPAALVAVLAAGGLLHGFALGEAVVGAETTPILAYLAGIAVIQVVLVGLLGYAMARPKVGSLMARPAVLRVAGLAIALAGVAVAAAPALVS
jgi:urease accessory protein